MTTSICFGLDEDEYHAVPALSYSGIKMLLESPEKYWWFSWMNPNRPPYQAVNHLERGKLWHCRMLEPENFNQKYVIAPWLLTKYDAARLDTVYDMRNFLRHNNYNPKGRSTWKREEYQAYLLEISERHHQSGGPAFFMPDIEMKKLIAHNPGKTPIEDSAILDDMLFAEKQMGLYKSMSHALNGYGYSEVSLFWEERGVPMKARIDRLNMDMIVDYKTMTTKGGKPLEKECSAAIGYWGYNMQGAVYMLGLANVVDALKSKTCTVFGDVDGKFIDGLLKPKRLQFHLLMQQVERPNAVRGKTISADNDGMFSAFGKGLVKMEEGLSLFTHYRETCGEGPWVKDEGFKEVEDQDIMYFN